MKPNPIFATIALLLALSYSDISHAQRLILWHSDGRTTEVDLINQPLVLFAGDKVLVTSPIINLEYDKSDVTRFTYSGKTEKVISAPKTDTDMEQKDGQIIFHNVKSTHDVAVYKANGIRVPVKIVFQECNAVLSLSQIPSGVYLFSVNGRTSKFTKK